MSGNYSGSCLCGKVKFEVEGEFDSFLLCHCEYCRKDTGSAHASNLLSSQATLKWIAGEDNKTTFNLPSTMHVKSFCNSCGSALPSLAMEGKMMVLPAGSLDSSIERKPDAHIFCASKAEWDTGFVDLPNFDKFPG